MTTTNDFAQRVIAAIHQHYLKSSDLHIVGENEIIEIIRAEQARWNTTAHKPLKDRVKFL